MKKIISLLLVLVLTLLCLTGCTKHPSEAIIEKDALEYLDGSGGYGVDIYSENYVDGTYTAKVKIKYDKPRWTGSGFKLNSNTKILNVEYKLNSNNEWELINIS